MATKVMAKLGPFLAAPMRVMTAAKEEDDEADLRTVCFGTKDKPHPTVRVNQRYRCPHVFDGKKPVQCTVEHSSYHPFPRGRENADKTFTVVTAEELSAAGASEDEKQTLTLMRAPKVQVDELAIPNGKFYWLGVGDGVGRENYPLFRDVIRETEDEWAWITVWAYRTAAHMVRVVRLGDVLGVQQIAWPAEVQQRPNVDVGAYDQRFLPLALQAADIVTVDFNPVTFSDTRKAKIAEILAEAETFEGAPSTPSTVVQGTVDAALVDLAAWIEENAKTVGGSSDTSKKAPRKRATKKTAETPPAQSLPDPVPGNVAVVTPKKRAAKKTTTAVKKSA